MQNPPSSAPARPLLIVGLLVLAAHLALLQLAATSWPQTGPRWDAPPQVIPVLPLDALAVLPATTAPATPPPPPPPRRIAPTRVAPAPAISPEPPPTPPTETTPTEAAPSNASTEVASGSAAAPAPQAAASTAAPDTPPRYAIPSPARLSYAVTGTVRGFNYFASAELLWRHDGQDYDARLEVGAFLLGSRVQTSRGRLTAQGLEPTRFSDKVRSEVAAHFDRDKGKVIFSANTPDVPLQAGAQDQLSVFMQLASLFAGQAGRYPPGSAIELQAVGPRDAAQWRFVVDGPQTLQLPGGEQATLKLTRPPAQSYDLKAELWLAPALGWLPARIRLTQDNGDFIDQQWRASAAP